jgi:hypothetical protein
MGSRRWTGSGSPPTAGGSGVDEVDAVLGSFGVAAHAVVEVGVAPVHDRVTRLQEFEQLVDHRFGGVAGRNHHPYGARLRQLGDELLNGEGAVRALGHDLASLLRGPVVGDDMVLVQEQASHHVGAHPAESDEAEFHSSTPP